ncbi:MAG: hypothetical protein LBE76_06645 [Nitrososphaerota archaeon]|nr:hypothetical protein [Nitrososphaerota archaeon]
MHQQTLLPLHSNLHMEQRQKTSPKNTKQYIGRITEQGLIPPKQKPQTTPTTHPTVKEYGATHTLNKLGQDIL